jgi:tRNA threonylcarbamoyladenosine biosynthesis protein TsaB
MLWGLHDARVRVLALETSTKVGSVALFEEGQLITSFAGGVDARHGDTLVPMIEKALVEAGWQVSDLALVAVGLGPGSFTGTRIAAACAKGLHVAAKVPLVGVSSFAALARRALQVKSGSVGVVADAGRGAVFAALYTEDGIAGTTFEASPEAAVERLGGADYFVGSAVLRYEERFARTLGAEFDQPRAEEVGVVGLELYGHRGADDASSLEPLYVRGSDAKLPATPLKVSRGL